VSISLVGRDIQDDQCHSTTGRGRFGGSGGYPPRQAVGPAPARRIFLRQTTEITKIRFSNTMLCECGELQSCRVPRGRRGEG
jgi:hypothetical protein